LIGEGADEGEIIRIGKLQQCTTVSCFFV
jgi:hypothetical protein